jgi:hypothetical protein
VSRVRFLFTFAAVLALVAGLAACGGSGDKSGEDPQTVIDDATLQGIESGVLDLSLGIVAKGKEGGKVDVSLSGPFQAGAEGKLPQLELKAKANGSVNGENVDFEGGLTLLPNSGYVGYEGVEYEIDPTTFSIVESALEEAQQQGGAEGESAGAEGCQEAAAGLKVADFVEGLKNEGDADVGGTSATKVSGELDAAGAIETAVELAESPACKAQLGAAGPLPPKSELEEAKGQVSESLKSAHVDVYVGDDDIVREVAAKLTIEPKSGDGSGPKSVAVDLDLKLTEVNEEQEIAAAPASQPLTNLFLKLGIDPVEVLELLQGEGGAKGLGGLLEGLSQPN